MKLKCMFHSVFYVQPHRNHFGCILYNMILSTLRFTIYLLCEPHHEKTCVLGY